MPNSLICHLLYVLVFLILASVCAQAELSAAPSVDVERYAYQYRKPGADIRLIEPSISIESESVPQTVTASLWVGRTVGDIRLDIAPVAGLDVDSQSLSLAPSTVTVGQVFPFSFDVFAEQVGLYRVPINVELRQQNGQILRRSLTLVIHVGLTEEGGRDASHTVEQSRLVRSKAGQLLKIYPAQEEIR